MEILSPSKHKNYCVLFSYFIYGPVKFLIEKPDFKDKKDMSKFGREFMISNPLYIMLDHDI